MDIRQTPAYEALMRAHHLLERAKIALTRPDTGIRSDYVQAALWKEKSVDEMIAADISKAMALVADRIPCDWCGDPHVDCKCGL